MSNLTPAAQAAIKEFENDLRDMTMAEVEREIRQAENELDEIEPWLEALVAWRDVLAARTRSTEQEVPEPLYKRVEAILDEHSAWIARPNDEVTKRIALAAMFAAHTVLVEEEAPEDRWLRDEAPTPAPEPGSVEGLVERLLGYAKGESKGSWRKKLLDEAADALTTLQQQLAAKDAESTDRYEALGRVNRLAERLEARATAAEAECAKLREALDTIAQLPDDKPGERGGLKRARHIAKSAIAAKSAGGGE